MSSFNITTNLQGLRTKLGRVVAGCEEAARPAAQAGAQVLYNRVRDLVPVSLKGHWFYGTSWAKYGTRYWFDAGTLKASIYQVYSVDNSGKGYATYHVAWNHQKAPYGFMVEFGTSRAPAHSFVRQARDRANDARDAVIARYLTELQARGVIKPGALPVQTSVPEAVA